MVKFEQNKNLRIRKRNLSYFRVMKRVRYFLAFCLPVVLVISCKKPVAFEYRDLRNFRIDSIGLLSSGISMDLVYFNPNNFNVDLKNVNCDIYINQAYLGKYVLDTTMHIAKRSEFTIPSHMQVDMKNIFKNTFVTLFSKDVLVEVKGTTRVGNSGIYITVPFDYSGRHQFSLF